MALVEKDNKTGQSVRDALRHLDNNVRHLEMRLVEMLAKRDHWLRHMDAPTDEDLKRKLEDTLRLMVEGTIQKLYSLFPKELLTETVRLARFAAVNLLNECESPITKLKDQADLPGTRAGELPKWRAVAELLLTSNGEFRKAVNKRIGFPPNKTPEFQKPKEDFKALLENLSGVRGLEEILNQVNTLPDPRYSQEEWDILKDLRHILPVAVRELKLLFSECSMMDFQGVTEAALHSLGPDDAPTDLMLSLDMRISHVLIDEFQDTSLTHLTLATALTRGFEPGDGRTLFLVGDPMQSIYLFRDAEVGLFLSAASRGLGSLSLTPLRLKTNFRSDPSIVDWINKTFTPAFPECEDIFTGSVTYAPSKGYSNFTDAEVDVTLYDDRAAISEATDIVSLVIRIKSRSEDETIAVLGMSRTHLAEIIELFKSEGIDFKTNNLDSLTRRPVVQDLFALLRAVMHPADSVAWLAVLRAPWCGLLLTDIHVLASAARESGLLVSELIKDSAKEATLSKDGQCKLNRLSDIFLRAAPLYGRVPVRELLEGLWIALGGPATLTGSADVTDAEAFLDMVEEISNSAEPLSIEVVEANLDKLYAAGDSATGNPVEVMTMHSAKGLEFDNVILPGLGRRARSDDKDLVLCMEKESELLLAPIEGELAREERNIYDYLWGFKKAKNSFEKTRLFYVAATRARKGLYLYGDVKITGDGVLKVDSSSLLSTIKESLTPSMVIAAEPKETVRATDTARPLLQLKRLRDDWSLPAATALVEGIVYTKADRDRKELKPSFDWAGEAAKLVGTVVHAYLYSIAKEGLTTWNENRIDANEERMKTSLKAHGLGDAEAALHSAQCVKILKNAITDEKGRWILSDHTDGEAEFAVSGVIN
ncbi:MAG: 3'-5' exonuclease, partial [Thermodesulfobacteriota bacterium]